MNHRRVGRREVLAGLAGGGVAALAGCLGVGGSDTSPLADHPVAEGLADQPTQGPAVGDATATVVAFEDPSCVRCAAFHRDTVPRLRSELVDPGTVSYVLRPYPVVFEWGEAATRALWATYERDAAAFWGLLDHYFTDQDAFSSGNVLDLTEAWLTAETSVDAAAVREAAAADGFPAPVQRNLDVGEAADVTGTPTVFLFRDGEYRTSASGSVSYEFVTSALEL
ncbi:DsbA family protein [Halomarina rubra]|uniref:DsbA family protein n=1 Tax=Halomarina rubra TaxID=2071873 RepID=A0ABD6AUB8_9EURY|nr:thioredoxin domain-containing protein [Halomarina rubra]